MGKLQFKFFYLATNVRCSKASVGHWSMKNLLDLGVKMELRHHIQRLCDITKLLVLKTGSDCRYICRVSPALINNSLDDTLAHQKFKQETSFVTSTRHCYWRKNKSLGWIFWHYTLISSNFNDGAWHEGPANLAR